jgi:hypothetical protein
MKYLTLLMLLFTNDSFASELVIHDEVKGEFHTLSITRPRVKHPGAVLYYLAEVYVMKVCQKLGKNYAQITWMDAKERTDFRQYRCENGKQEDLDFQKENVRIICLSEDTNEDIREACADIDFSK